MSAQRCLRRLGAVGLIITAGTTAYPVESAYAQRVLRAAIEWSAEEFSRYIPRSGLDIPLEVLGAVKREFSAGPVNGLGYLPPGSDFSAQWRSVSPDGNGFLAASRATISRQPLLLDRSSGLHGLLDDRIGA
jgi:hypothetical protein